MLAKCGEKRLVVERFFDDKSKMLLDSETPCEDNTIKSYLSKIITAGVIRAAEPAATSESANRSSPSRLPLR